MIKRIRRWFRSRAINHEFGYAHGFECCFCRYYGWRSDLQDIQCNLNGKNPYYDGIPKGCPYYD